MAHDVHDVSTSSFQRGNCIILSAKKAKGKVVSMGRDPKALGRWTWTRHSERQNISLRVISTYLCGNGTRAGSEHNQQMKYFQSIVDWRNPVMIMLEDLKE